METTVEPLAIEPTNGENDANSTDAKVKRKSVSFVDEKLILDALNSTNSTSNGSSSAKTSGKANFARSTSDKPLNGTPGRNHPAGRNGSVPSSNGKRYPNGAANGHSKGGASHKSPYGATATKNNPVIVYYQQAEINVDQLLTQPADAESAKAGNDHNGQASHVPKNAALSNGNKYALSTNGAKTNGTANGHPHPVKFADNWRTKGLRMDQPQYQPMKVPANGERHSNGHRDGGKHAGRGHHNGHSQPKTPHGKTNGTFEKVTAAAPRPLEPITIYYTAPESSEVIEQNLKQLQLAKDSSSATPSNGVSDSNSEKPQKPDIGEAEKKANLAADGTATESSQENVINGSQSPEDEAKSTAHQLPPPPSSGDQYDVISGGVPIEGPVLPTEGEKHLVRCTLVSHPGHFYVRFVNAAHETVLENMNEFYNNDESHIDLTVDVLKAGQFFAACRLKPPTEAKEWIRVQLQSVDDAELINCLLIDEGCFGIFKVADLQPLYNQFRSVPKQAIRASLFGVIPKEIDWMPQQSLDFKKLVSERQFHTGQQLFDSKAFEEKQALQIELYFTDGEFADRSVADIIVERDIASKK